jgi:hypothetical protein
LAWSAGGDAMGRAAVSAAVVGLAASVLAEALGRLAPPGPSQVVVRYLLGMGVRMGLPLVAVIAVVAQRGPLYQSGAVVFLGLFYLMALAAEIAVSTRSASAVGPLGGK